MATQARDPIRLRDALGDLMGLLEPHLDEHDGNVYETPSLIRTEDDITHGNDAYPVP